LRDRDAGHLPSAQQLVGQPASPEEGQRIHVADGEVMTQVEAGVAPVGRNVIGIDEVRIGPVGRIVNRVAVGVSRA
jgi:hypothetical protein